VRNYLIKKGISGDNIIAKGYGATNPVATNDTPEGRQQNRRTEVHIKN
jgi:OOP family OmpA-OmpF porin